MFSLPNFDDSMLLCPECNNPMLHQIAVNVIFRDKEDADGILTKIKTKETVICRVEDKDIPGRRDVLTIDFGCELCDVERDCPKGDLCFQQNWCDNHWKVHTLQIVQHKGSTFFQWIKSETQGGR
jgi:hypothetical protein